jgi:septal ring factor EnvC (AmiA/AmiB activator)
VIRYACIAALLALPAPAPAQGDPASELKELRGRLERLQRQLEESEQSRSQAADALRSSERAISQANRRLFQLAAERRTVQERLAQIDADYTRLATSVAKQQDALARQVYARYVSGEPALLPLLTGQQDPNEVARRMRYLGYLMRARSDAIGALRSDMAQLEALSRETRQASEALARVEAEQAEQRRQLEAQKRERREVLARVSSDVRRHERQIGTLRENEARLSALVERLARELEAQRARAARQAGSRVRNEILPQAGQESADFQRLKGRLRLPVVGELANRFGSPRHDTGLTWNGLFLASRTGAEVRAIAAGRVVFADWLRGFGNLLILDHGGGYMSLYGNNESVLRQPGDSVRAGDAIAAVGSSGGSAETGLYFEIRYRGKPVDPLSWVTLK